MARWHAERGEASRDRYRQLGAQPADRLREAEGGMIYRPRTIKRERRSAARVEQLDRQIIEVLTEDHPQSVRHVFYRMTNLRLEEPVEKSDRGYRHVQYRIVELRRAGILPYGWISD